MTSTLNTTDRLKFFKVVKHSKIHHDYTYKDGLNVLQTPFNDSVYDSCAAGGFYITTLEYIPNYYHFGEYLYEVHLPYDDYRFKLVRDPQGDKWRTNMLLLGEKYSLYNPKTYEHFGLPKSSRHAYIFPGDDFYGARDELLTYWPKDVPFNPSQKYNAPNYDELTDYQRVVRCKKALKYLTIGAGIAAVGVGIVKALTYFKR